MQLFMAGSGCAAGGGGGGCGCGCGSLTLPHRCQFSALARSIAYSFGPMRAHYAVLAVMVWAQTPASPGQPATTRLAKLPRGHGLG